MLVNVSELVVVGLAPFVEGLGFRVGLSQLLLKGRALLEQVFGKLDE